MKIIRIFIFLLLPEIAFSQASDSILTYQQAKARLIAKNLSLIASYYDINIADAQVVQAKLWNNPYFIWNQELYNVEKNKYLQYKNQYLVQVEQIFSIAGKHTNTVKLARINLDISKVQFQDVIRSLVFDLGTTYNNLSALQQKEILYQTVFGSYEKLINVTREQLRVGAISQTEAFRLESEYIAVKAQSVQNYNSKEQTLAHIRVLLQIPTDSVIIVEQRTPIFSENLNVDSLISNALQIRPDLKVAKLNREYQDRNLKLQHSMSVPDLKLGYQPHDQGSNYIRPYSGINLEFPLPFFDRNQGRIKAAQFQISQSQYELQRQSSMVKNEVVSSYKQYQRSNEGLANYTPDFLNKLIELNKNSNQNFQKRIISLLEFIDQQRIFIQTNIQLIELRQQYLESVNKLNFSIGKELIDY